MVADAEIAALMSDARERRGVTRQALADRTGMVEGTITAAELGDRSPNLRTVLRHARGLGYVLCIRFVPKHPMRLADCPSRAPTVGTLSQFAAGAGMHLAITFEDDAAGAPLVTPLASRTDGSSLARSLKQQLAAHICRQLAEARLSPQTAADAVGFTRATFTRLLRGNLRGFTLDRLLDILHCVDPEATVTLLIEPATSSPEKTGAVPVPTPAPSAPPRRPRTAASG